MSKCPVESMIGDLTEDLAPCKPLRHPFLRVLPWVAGVGLYVWLVVSQIGLRGDYMKKLSEPDFLFENISMGLVGISSALCASWLCVPDMRGQRWMIAVPLSMLFMFLLWSGLHFWVEGHQFPALHMGHCMEDGFWLAALPAAIMVFISMRGATTKPCLSALMVSLAVASFGYIGLRFTCSMDTVAHAMIYHLIPFILLGSAFGFLARRLYRW